MALWFQQHGDIGSRSPRDRRRGRSVTPGTPCCAGRGRRRVEAVTGAGVENTSTGGAGRGGRGSRIKRTMIGQGLTKKRELIPATNPKDKASGFGSTFN